MKRASGTQRSRRRSGPGNALGAQAGSGAVAGELRPHARASTPPAQPPRCGPDPLPVPDRHLQRSDLRPHPLRHHRLLLKVIGTTRASRRRQTCRTVEYEEGEAEVRTARPLRCCRSRRRRDPTGSTVTPCGAAGHGVHSSASRKEPLARSMASIPAEEATDHLQDLPTPLSAAPARPPPASSARIHGLASGPQPCRRRCASAGSPPTRRR